MKDVSYTPRVLKVLTRAEAAQLLRISSKTMDKIVKKGKIRKFIAGSRKIRFLQEDIEDYIFRQFRKKAR